MSGTTVIAITAIIVSGVVGPTVAALWHSHHERQQRVSDREKLDLTELRTVIDHAMAACAAMSVAFGHAQAARLRGDADEVGRVTAELFERQLDVIAAGQRLDVRLGRSHPVTDAYWPVVETLGVGRLVTPELQSEGGATAASFDAMLRDNAHVGVDYGAKLAKFSDEAQRFIGSKL